MLDEIFLDAYVRLNRYGNEAGTDYYFIGLVYVGHEVFRFIHQNSQIGQ